MQRCDLVTAIAVKCIGSRVFFLSFPTSALVNTINLLMVGHKNVISMSIIVVSLSEQNYYKGPLCDGVCYEVQNKTVS